MPDLLETIQRVVDRIRVRRSLYEQNEMAIRDQVVNPILRSLGWDTEDPDKVQPNVSTEEGVPDYTLMLHGKKVLFVEAKKMSVNVEDRKVLGQLAKYCFAEGMPYGVVTNGVVWVLFRAFEKGRPIAERVVWKVNIDKDDINAIIRKLNTISIGSISDIDRLPKKLQILDEVWQTLLENPVSLVKALVPAFLSIAQEVYSDYDLTPEEVMDFIQERLNEIILRQPELPPTPATPELRTMRIGGDTFTIRRAKDILVNTAEWLIKQGRLRKEDCPVVSGHRRYIVHIEPKHPHGRGFFVPKKLSNGLFIETHFSASRCIANAKKLLKHCGFSETLLEVQIPQGTKD